MSSSLSKPPLMSAEEIDDSITSMFKMSYFFPAQLGEEGSTFREELTTLITKHIQERSITFLTEDEWRFLQDPNVVIISSRAGQKRTPLMAYDRASHTIVKLDQDRYLVLQRYFRKQRRPASFQARSVSTAITDCTGEYNREDDSGWPRRELDDWLPLRSVSKRASHRSSWLPYCLSLIGQEATKGGKSEEPPTVVEMKLSALFLLYHMGNNRTSENEGPTLGEDGIWRLPEMSGNKGQDEHLFVDISEDVTVQVA